MTRYDFLEVDIEQCLDGIQLYLMSTFANFTCCTYKMSKIINDIQIGNHFQNYSKKNFMYCSELVIRGFGHLKSELGKV